MALVLRAADGTERMLTGTTVVGRASESEWCIDRREISSRHAEIRWTESGWMVRDLGSRNGTFVDGQRIAPGEDTDIRVGTRMGVATSQGWTVVSAEAPRILAIGPRLVCKAGASGLLAIPEADDPTVVVLGAASGWVAEWSSGRAEQVVDGQVLRVEGESWRLVLPEVVDQTADMTRFHALYNTALHFRVSRDEEHVELTVELDGSTHALKPRTHHYTLLTLARVRAQDADSALSEDERGWVLQEQLERMLQLDANVVYKHIHRARKELIALGIADASDIVQRRPTAGQLRLGIDTVRIDSL